MTNKITGKKPGSGKAGPGRPKGSRNKVTSEAKAVIAEAAERLGGVERLVAWARADAQNEKAFWAQVYPKLLPLQVTGEGGGPVKIARVELVALTDDGDS
ncbi:hypothetical protein OF122_13010 [Pelagibacterium flavum]|uniref:Terminase n=1 Tax=Pelagibacterium flavum TaxID=2984530 RepID=A0ABY6IK79_9HYPH|nr:hypothetical protein [Pelagibacterium sp. YIM 151497]UYQ70978.1 hypothetical protein OF122_13010 [Pelagibacterium sp. YIM 151497]